MHNTILQQLKARVRKLTTPTYPDQHEELPQINDRGDLLVAQALPERSELARLGQSFLAAIPSGSAFTYVNALPTTRAELILSNGEPAGGKSYIIDRAWMFNITSAAASQPFALLGQLCAAGLVANATDNSAVLRQPTNGSKLNYGGNARLALANTAFCLANRWNVLSHNYAAGTANLGMCAVAELFGRYIVPPNAAFGLAGVGGTAAGTAIIGVEWHEVQLPC